MNQLGKKTNGRAGIAGLIALVGTLVFNFAAGIADADGNWWSPAPYHRIQADRLIQGHFVIADHPAKNFHDSAWGNGLNQIWGLGVPILRVPFELVAGAFGLEAGFPDRLFILVFVLIVFWALVYSVILLAENLSLRRPFSYLLAATVGVVAFLGHPVLTLMQVNGNIYGEGVLYGNLWAYLALALLVLAVIRQSTAHALIASFVFGFGCLIRPTMLLYSIGFFGTWILVSLSRGIGIRRTAAMIGCFSVGPVFLLVSNIYRFGSALEWGYHLALSGLSLDALGLRFGTPFSSESLFGAVSELFSSLFLVTNQFNTGFFSGQPAALGGSSGLSIPLQSQAMRFREFNFSTFSWFTLALLAISWVVLPMAFQRHSAQTDDADDRGLSAAFSVFLAGLISFGLLFIFYLWAPSIGSRYMVDFAPAIHFQILALVILVIYLLSISDRSWALIGLLVSVGAWQVIECSLAEGNRFRPDEIRAVSADAARRNFDAFYDKPVHAIPNLYSCGSNPERSFDDFVGWDIFGTCQIQPVTYFFIQDARCFLMKYQSIAGHAWAPLVKNGLKFLEKREERWEANSVVATFCNAPEPTSFSNPFDLISILWVDPSQAPPASPPFKLLEFKGL